MGNYADPEEFSWSQPGLSFKRITPFPSLVSYSASANNFEIF